MAGPDNTDWSDIRIRPRNTGPRTSPDDNAHTRFVLGAVLFVAVALAYPWYSYWVQSRLLTAEVEQALAVTGHEMQAIAHEADAAFGQARTAATVVNARAPRPRILGVSEGTTAVIVADLDGASVVDATADLCRQATRWTRRSSDGRTFRVQSYRRPAPAVTVGSIQC